METRFGRDFSDVRIHSDGQAADSARAVRATAYTVGNDIVFNSSKFAPGATTGRQLIAHELTHVVQQSAGAPAIQLQPSHDSGDDDGVKIRGPRPISLSGLDYEHLCGGQPCYLDDDDLPYAREMKERREREQLEELERAKQDDEAARARLNSLRRKLSEHAYYPRSEILKAISRISMRAAMFVEDNRCQKGMTQMAYQKCVIEALDQYDLIWRRAYGDPGGQMSPTDPAAVQAQQKKEAVWRAGAEGTEYVTGSFGGALGAEITSIFTDDPETITAGAGIGAAASGVLGSLAAAFGGSYSPRVVGEGRPAAVGSWRYRGPAPTKEVPPAATPKSEPATDPWAATPSETPKSEEKKLDSPAKGQTSKRPGINWNPFRGKSLTEYLPLGANTTATSLGKDPVTFKGFDTTAKGGRVWASPDNVDHYHIEDLVSQLMKAKPGQKIEIITGVHGSRVGSTTKEYNFLLEDYGIAPASKDLVFHDAAAISNVELKSVLLSGHEVILAWCSGEFTRRIIVALGMNLKKAPF